MTDKSIKVGDLVMQIKPCKYCGDATGLGLPFTVERIFAKETLIINCCRHVNSEPAALNNIFGAELSNLIKIDPPALLKTIETEKELTV